MQAKISKRSVDAATPEQGWLWDTEIKGFGLRVRSLEHKTYVVEYRPGVGGRSAPKRRYSIGRHGDIGPGGKPWTPDTARDEAKRILGLVANGRDPAADRSAAKTAETVAELCTRFLEEHASEHKKASSVAADRRNIRNHILPLLGKLKVGDVSRGDVDRFKRAVAQGKTAKEERDEDGALKLRVRGGTGAANRCLAILSKMFNLAEVWGLRPDGSNPTRHVEKYAERKVERLLSAEDLERLGDALRDAELRCGASEALDAEIAAARQNKNRAKARDLAATRRDLGFVPSRSAIAAVRLLVFTGARLSEILGLRWEWIDFERGEARLPDSKTGAKVLHLPPPALEVLAGLQRLKDNPYVIVGERPRAALVNLEKPWRAIRKAATVYQWAATEGAVGELVERLAKAAGKQPTFEECQLAAGDAELELPEGLSNVRLHDLRHAFASVGAASGMGLPIIGKMLGHSQAQTTARYAHLAADPVKAAAAAVAGKIASAMSGKNSTGAEGGNVVALGTNGRKA